MIDKKPLNSIKNKEENQKMELNLLSLGGMLKKSCKNDKCLGKKKPPHLVRVLRRKTENLEKTSHIKKRFFLLLGKTRPKIR